MLARQHSIQPFFEELLANQTNSVDDCIDGGRNRSATPTLACFRSICFQKDTCLHQKPSRTLARRDQLGDTMTLQMATKRRHF